jgi:hypothetical protein
MLTSDDGSRDGEFRAYLDKPAFAKYDRDLFACLKDLRRLAPSASLIERSDLLPRTRYYSEIVPDARLERDAWRTDLLQEAKGVDLVFLDPDNGIEVRSKSVGRKGSSKYVMWQEIQALWQAGCSLLIYQHFRRERRDAFAQRRVDDVRLRTGARFVEAFRPPYVLFLLAAQDRHAQRFMDVVPLISERWRGQIDPMRLAGAPTTES